MNYQEFKKFLEKHNLSLKEFSELTDLSYSGINKWKYSAMPSWVKSWCVLYEENKKLNYIKNTILELCKENSKLND